MLMIIEMPALDCVEKVAGFCLISQSASQRANRSSVCAIVSVVVLIMPVLATVVLPWEESRKVRLIVL